mmetsp:Transcript_18240/g.32103  ORF Transcript_18240/g.32103 Transcript_18240/m.32103 type:complete len:96 (+) Transcript_18240:964-1251(+)
MCVPGKPPFAMEIRRDGDQLKVGHTNKMDTVPEVLDSTAHENKITIEFKAYGIKMCAACCFLACTVAHSLFDIPTKTHPLSLPASLLLLGLFLFF